MRTRRRFSAASKANVALEAIKGHETVASWRPGTSCIRRRLQRGSASVPPLRRKSAESESRGRRKCCYRLPARRRRKRLASLLLDQALGRRRPAEVVRTFYLQVDVGRTRKAVPTDARSTTGWRRSACASLLCPTSDAIA